MTTKPIVIHANIFGEQREQLFLEQIQHELPSALTKLTFLQEEKISTVIQQYWGINALASLDGHRLNHVYGYMGLEQHLPRFPGDSIELHSETEKKSGMTPGKGAWGYFTQSKETLSQEDIQREMYYVAVQTLYLPDWNTKWSELKEWYKFRKVLVVNTQNGKTIVADIADSGPANWTGKQFGGSPEVMTYLGLRTGKQKGKVLVMFISDPENQIPLGPVVYTGNK